MSSVREVFDSITHCPNVAVCLDGDTSNPCYKIVRSQEVLAADFQLPEPWRGQVEKARILFVGSNPSIGDDRYGTLSSADEQVWESQHLAFGGGSRPYIADGHKTTTEDGSPGRCVPYWASIRARARELLPDAVPGTDYAITEIVHCKSQHEEGVREAAGACYSRHMNHVFSVAQAHVVVFLGKVPRDAILGVEVATPFAPLQLELGGKTRTALFLPHPNQRGDKKSFAAHYRDQDLAELREQFARA